MSIHMIRARQMMAQEDIRGEHLCASCGRQNADTPFSRGAKTNFTDIQGLAISSGVHLCSGCLRLLDDPDMRYRPLLFNFAGVKRVLEREEVLQTIASPPSGQFVLSVPYSFKKHHWLYAGVSDAQTLYIGTDNRTVVVRYSDQPDKAIDAILQLLLLGVPRHEVITGKYSIYTIARYNNSIAQYDPLIVPFRPSGACELFVKYTPAIKSPKKNKTDREDITMITDTEQKATEILACIIKRSQMRQNDPMRFWSELLPRRVARYMHLDLHGFLSKLSGSIESNGTNDILIHLIKDMSQEDEAACMGCIRSKSNLIIALVHTQIATERLVLKC